MQTKLIHQTLHLVIGEPFTLTILYCIRRIILYIKNGDNSFQKYWKYDLPYTIDYIEMDLTFENNPRYYLEEGHHKQGCRYCCLIIPFGEKKGFFRLGLDMPYLIKSFETNEVVLKLVKTNEVLN